jgi:hypothetical protein
MTERSSKLAEIAERHAQTSPGEWHWVEGMLQAAPHETVLWPRNSLAFEDAERQSEIIGACGLEAESRAAANMEFIARAHQDVPRLIAELAAERERSLKLAELLREAEKRLSVHATTMDANLTKHGCALCGSWVWDDSEENIKPIVHKPDCLITQIHAADDLTQPVSGEGGGK